MYQAGVKNISLYENNQVSFRYFDLYDLSQITDLQNVGFVYNIENMQRPVLDIELTFGKNGKILYNYKLEFILFGLLTDNQKFIEALALSIYGWSLLVEFYDGTFKFYPITLNLDSANIKPQSEMTFAVKMSVPIPSTSKHLNYIAGVTGIPTYRFDTELMSWDDTIYTWDYEL